jgi:flagellar biosynthesis protein FliQ
VSDTDVINIATQALWTATKLAAPILIVSLTIGTLVSLFQAVTQVQEMTLSFVPKLAGIALVLVLSGSWMLAQMSDFTRTLFESIPRLLGVT